MRIEYLTIFEAYHANRLLEERRNELFERDHHFGVTRFEVSDEEYKFLKEKGIKFVDIENKCSHDYWVNATIEPYCASCGERIYND